MILGFKHADQGMPLGKLFQSSRIEKALGLRPIGLQIKVNTDSKII